MDEAQKFREFMDFMNEKRKSEANSGGHMTVGELYDALSKSGADLDLPIFVGEMGGLSPYSPHSYRGYYDDLSFGLSSDNVEDVCGFMNNLSGAVGETFEGWKGGEYTMGWDTLLWFSGEGDCSGVYPVDVDVHKNKVIILTDVEKW